MTIFHLLILLLFAFAALTTVPIWGSLQKAWGLTPWDAGFRVIVALFLFFGSFPRLILPAALLNAWCWLLAFASIALQKHGLSLWILIPLDIVATVWVVIWWCRQEKRVL